MNNEEYKRKKLEYSYELHKAHKFFKKARAVVVNDDMKKTVKATLTRPAGYQGRIYDLESGKAMNAPVVDVPAKGFRLVVFEEK